jgi:hypothetical protein
VVARDIELFEQQVKLGALEYIPLPASNSVKSLAMRNVKNQ